jgi:dTMP kinase
MKRPIPGGLLVAVEGIDGAGKTSISTLLAQWCGEMGLGCTISKEPTSRKWGQELRASSREGRLTLERELELFELDRRDHIEASIRPSLAEGNIVILDRYYWSTAAYQGGRGGDFRNIFQHHAAFAPRPDLVLVLDLEVESGLRRIQQRGDKPNLFEDKDALGKARNIFLQLAAENDNALVIPSAGHLKETYSPVFKAFGQAAIRKLPPATQTDPTWAEIVSVLRGGA